MNLIRWALARALTTAALTYCWLVPCWATDPLASSTRSPAPASAAATNPSQVLLPDPLPDPIEPINRLSWEFNRGLMTGVIKPTAKVYRFVVRKPLRIGISNFGRNISYPGRLINNLLEAKWAGARDETYRFLCNSTLGLAGFFDLATRWQIPKSDADFGQTFGQWGWKPHAYIMLPIYGPSNERDTVGLAADVAANPLTYVTPYSFSVEKPLTYFSPYTYTYYVVTYNNLSDSVDDYVRFARTEKDPYSVLEYAWTYVRENQVVDFKVLGEPDPASLETLQSVFFAPKDPGFPEYGKTRSIRIPSTGRKLRFTFWLHPGKAPVVYIVPGLGSHRLAETALALAELVYSKGFSAVCISNPFNYEFMEQASSAALPGYTPMDAHDLHVALSEVDRRLTDLYPRRFGAKALLGYSMGGFLSLLTAAESSTNAEALIHFDRYIAINTPVRLTHGISKLDEFYQAPSSWPAEDRAQNIENTFLKVAALTKNSFTPQTTLPFSGVESKFLIGVVFRLILRDTIYSSQARTNLGVLEHPIRKLRRQPLYHEILQYSYRDYFDRFVVPYYLGRGIDLRDPAVLEKASDLRTYSAGLIANPNIHLIGNRNDFLLTEPDLEWLQSVFGPDRLTLFEQGGHLGNLANPAVQKAIVDALHGLPQRQ